MSERPLLLVVIILLVGGLAVSALPDAPPPPPACDSPGQEITADTAVALLRADMLERGPVSVRLRALDEGGCRSDDLGFDPIPANGLATEWDVDLQGAGWCRSAAVRADGIDRETECRTSDWDGPSYPEVWPHDIVVIMREDPDWPQGEAGLGWHLGADRINVDVWSSAPYTFFAFDPDDGTLVQRWDRAGNIEDCERTGCTPRPPESD